MTQVPSDDNAAKVWELIRSAHSALLVTATPDGRFDSRPMGCIRSDSESDIWFMTFLDSEKVREIEANDHVLVCYANSRAYEYVSLSGRARVIRDERKARELWSEGFRVWFPGGPRSHDLALISVHADEVKFWINPASAVTYAWAYVKARVAGKRPDPGEIVDSGTMRP